MDSVKYIDRFGAILSLMVSIFVNIPTVHRYILLPPELRENIWKLEGDLLTSGRTAEDADLSTSL